MKVCQWTDVMSLSEYLMCTRSKSQTQLSAHHHGFIDPPVLAADRTPTLAAAHLHEHLHSTLWGQPAASQTHLETRITIIHLWMPKRVRYGGVTVLFIPCTPCRFSERYSARKHPGYVWTSTVEPPGRSSRGWIVLSPCTAHCSCGWVHYLHRSDILFFHSLLCLGRTTISSLSRVK